MSVRLHAAVPAVMLRAQRAAAALDMSAREVERLDAPAGQPRVSRSRLLRQVLREAAGDATASAVPGTRELLGLLAERARAGDAAAARALREHWRDRGRDR